MSNSSNMNNNNLLPTLLPEHIPNYNISLISTATENILNYSKNMNVNSNANASLTFGNISMSSNLTSSASKPTHLSNNVTLSSNLTSCNSPKPSNTYNINNNNNNASNKYNNNNNSINIHNNDCVNINGNNNVTILKKNSRFDENNSDLTAINVNTNVILSSNNSKCPTAPIPISQSSKQTASDSNNSKKPSLTITFSNYNSSDIIASMACGMMQNSNLVESRTRGLYEQAKDVALPDLKSDKEKGF